MALPARASEPATGHSRVRRALPRRVSSSANAGALSHPPRRPFERGLDVHQAPLGRDARRAHARRRGAHLPRRRARPHRPRTRERCPRPRRHQRQLEDRRACLRHRRRVPPSGQPRRARRHSRDRAPARGAGSRRRGRQRRGRVALARRRHRRARRQARAKYVPAAAGASTSTTSGSRSSACRRPKRDVFKSLRYVPFDVVQTTRGCPFPCEFCSVSTYNGTKFRFRPVPEVIAELETCGPRILFGDDNVMIHTKYSHELFEAMVPLRKHWVAQASLAALHRVENVDVMARAGCRALFIGFESVADRRRASRRQEAEQAAQVPRRRTMPRRPRHRRVGQLHLRPRRRRPRLLRPHGRVLRRGQGDDGALRAPDAVSGHGPLQAPRGRGTPHQGRAGG